MTSLVENIDFVVVDLDKMASENPGQKICLDYLPGDRPTKPVWLKSDQAKVELEVNLKKDCAVKFFWMQAGEARQQVRATFNLKESGIRLEIYNFYHLLGRAEVSNRLQINHLAENCESFTLFKGVLEGQARADFFGQIYVTSEAHQTDAKLANHSVLLSDEARVESKPELEIYCDDVKCTHGSTIGHFDPQQDFYLQSRGLDETTRQEILTKAFLLEVVEELEG